MDNYLDPLNGTAADVLDELRKLETHEQLEILREWFADTWNSAGTVAQHRSHAISIADILSEAGYR